MKDEQRPGEDLEPEPQLELDDFKQGFLTGWMHAQGWTGVPTFEEFNAAALAWEAWMDAQKATKQ